MNKLKLGTAVRTLRMQQQRTIQEIANACGLSKSMISKIETNNVIPSVSTLVKLASSLGTSVSALLENPDGYSSIFYPREKAESGITQTERGYHIFPYASEYKDKKMQPFLFIAKKGEVKEHHVTHEGEEFLYILEGKMKFQVGDLEYTMNEGDSLYFNSLETHQVIPISDSVKYIDIFV
jgi:transcriptional regulator with XRE-family HTH domain